MLSLTGEVSAQDGAENQQPQVNETPAPADTEAVQASQAESTAPEEIEALIVTGSRIRRNEFNSPSPIQVITREVSTQAGLVSTAEIIQGSTVASGSPQNTFLFDQFVTDGGPGIKTVSLRGLGANRTLVLLNGRRMAPAGVGGTTGAGIDLNVLPSSVLQRVEILKDGASSVYGSDAVAGVVNAITTTNFDGWEFGAYRTIGQRGGGEETSVEVTFGKQFDRGNLLLAAEYQKQNVLYERQRDWAKCGYDNLRDPETGEDLSYRNADGSRKCVSGTWQGFIQTAYGHYLVPDASSTIYAGTLPGYRRLQLDPFGVGGIDETSYEGPLDDHRMVVYPSERLTLTGFVNYDLSMLGGAEVYGEFLYNKRKTRQDQVGQLFTTIGPEDPRNPLVPLLGDYLPPSYAYSYLTPVSSILYRDRQEVDYTRAVGGLRGDLKAGFLSGWSWDAYYLFSRSSADYGGNRMLADRFANMLDLDVIGGEVVCADPTARAAGCLPMPWFENRFLQEARLTPQEYDYLISDEFGSTVFTSHLVNASMTGDLFKLPAGPLAAAVGFELRRDMIDDQPSPNSQIGNVYGALSAGRTKGTEKVYEVFGELEAPLLRQLPLIEDLTLNSSVRYTQYVETGFKDTTYKVGLNWTINPVVRLRSTYGTSFRAPALYELFLGAQTGFYTGTDPCRNFGIRDPNSNLYINCASELGADNDDFPGFLETPLITTYGARGRPPGGPFGDDLTAEGSNAFTAGVIWTPGFADLSIAVDYFDIEVNGQIAQLGAGSVLSACYGDEDFRTPGTFCDLVSERTPYDPLTGFGGDIEFIDTSYFNIDSQYTAGWDVTIRYERELPFGDLTVDNRTTITTTDKINIFGSLDDINGTIGDPRVTAQTDFQLERGDWTYFWRADYYSAQNNFRLYLPPNDQASTSMYDIEVDERWYHTASVSYEADDWEATFGLSNVFDEKPDRISSGFTRIGNVAATSQMDPFGRTLFISLRKSLQ